jgi:hypothetical protein
MCIEMRDDIYKWKALCVHSLSACISRLLIENQCLLQLVLHPCEPRHCRVLVDRLYPGFYFIVVLND